MSQSNIENFSPSKSTKKPLAFVQPVIRNLHSVSNSSQNQTQQESFSYVSQIIKKKKKKKISYCFISIYQKIENMINSGNKFCC
jgi:hypothetical protein